MRSSPFARAGVGVVAIVLAGGYVRSRWREISRADEDVLNMLPNEKRRILLRW